MSVKDRYAVTVRFPYVIITQTTSTETDLKIAWAYTGQSYLVSRHQLDLIKQIVDEELPYSTGVEIDEDQWVLVKSVLGVS